RWRPSASRRARPWPIALAARPAGCPSGSIRQPCRKCPTGTTCPTRRKTPARSSAATCRQSGPARPRPANDLMAELGQDFVGVIMRQMPSLNGLRAFEAAGRLGSFAAAADELNVTQTAISRMVRLLEQRLGYPLFNRRANGLAISERGAALLPGVSAAFDDLA